MITSNIHLGEGVTIDPTTSINNVIISNGVKIAKYCSIYGSQNNFLEIGDHSWIGTAAILMQGVELGEFRVVAANSFINKSFPAYSVIGGSPAKLIKLIEIDKNKK